MVKLGLQLFLSVMPVCALEQLQDSKYKERGQQGENKSGKFIFIEAGGCV